MLNRILRLMAIAMVLTFSMLVNAQDLNEQSQSVVTESVNSSNIKIEKLDIEKVVVDTVSGKEQALVKPKTVDVPFIVILLVCGSIFFTFWFRFINIRMFTHSLSVIRGKYDNPDDKGEISHFKALTSALSATVGLGNIAGVAIAIKLGGPGAVFWMTIAAVFGMCAKFCSCTLSQLYRQENEDGSISGGPMYYLDLGLKSKGLGPLGKVLGISYAVFIIFAAIGAGNMFQANQSFAAFYDSFLKDENNYVVQVESSKPAGSDAEKETTVLADVNNALLGVFFADISGGSIVHPGGEQEAVARTVKVPNEKEKQRRALYAKIFGLILAALVGLVILGGVKRIGAATEKIVPLMCGLYIIASLCVILNNFSEIPAGFAKIFGMAFSENAMYGGFVGVLIQGLKRAAFSNEAGLGSASIMHAAAKTKEPVREGIVAMIGPFIDTIVICNMTALVVVLSGVWEDFSIPANAGVELTQAAFAGTISWFPAVLAVCIILFAYSTMISWCYYAERGWIYIFDHFAKGFGFRTLPLFRIIFVGFIVVGAINSLDDVLLFSDMMLFSMSFPNILGSLLLVPAVRKLMQDYVKRYKAGEFKAYK
ncbi:MAG: alanine:cation symporter family protein [Lentisphaeraceae bacterium]|nr:alanine:cation symporter family protein [Lentisphaeraceae bacterium]